MLYVPLENTAGDLSATTSVTNINDVPVAFRLTPVYSTADWQHTEAMLASPGELTAQSGDILLDPAGSAILCNC